MLNCERLHELVNRAQQGDETALPELREALDADPALWEKAGDLSKVSLFSMVLLVSGKDLHRRECMLRKVESLRQELAGPEPTPIEKLLVERIISSWLETSYFDVRQDHCNITLAQAGYLSRQRDSSQRRYLAAIKALATLRKLLPKARQPGRGSGDPLEVLRLSKDREADALLNGVPVMN